MKIISTLGENYKPLRSQLVDKMGRPMTQSLFLETGYSDFAIYTLKNYDHVYKGKKYVSLQQRYLEMEDVAEYEFATTYFVDFQHWVKITENAMLSPYVDQWRYELELKIRSKAAKKMKELAEGGSYQAAKWMADKGWAGHSRGRPSKAEIEREKKIQTAISDDFKDDINRMSLVK